MFAMEEFCVQGGRKLLLGQAPTESNCTVRNRRCHFWSRSKCAIFRTEKILYTVYAINYLQAEACSGCTCFSPDFQVFRDEDEADDEDDDNDKVAMLMTGR